MRLMAHGGDMQSPQTYSSTDYQDKIITAEMHFQPLNAGPNAGRMIKIDVFRDAACAYTRMSFNGVILDVPGGVTTRYQLPELQAVGMGTISEVMAGTITALPPA